MSRPSTPRSMSASSAPGPREVTGESGAAGSPRAPGSGLLLVISGPSGVGKTTITHEIERRLGGVFSVSVTTRAPTAADVEGRDYFFIDEARFKHMVDRGELLEYAQVFGSNWYGTPGEPVTKHLGAGRLVILEIDVQGGLQVKEKMPGAYMMFVLPPDDEELWRRLRGRGRDDEATMKRRFAEAKREIETARRSGAYDVMLVNDSLERAIDEACRLVQRRRGEG